MKKRILSAALALTMAGTFIPTAFASSYSDLDSNHWAYGEISVCTENGLFEGFSDGTFKANDTMTREDATTALSRQFKDADFSAYLDSTDKKGAITREEAAYLLAVAKELKNTDKAALDKFSDKNEISPD